MEVSKTVEFQMAKRVGISIARQTINEDFNQGPKILPFCFPKISSLVPTFDCEGKYGGGSSTKGESEVVPQILSLFNSLNCKGTFNFVGKTAKEYEEVVRELDKSGNDIWGHGFSHIYLDDSKSTQKREVTETVNMISKIIGKPCIGWRSPYGTFNLNLYKILLKNGIRFGSNWGSSTWGVMPFTPIINGEKIDIYELPFDDSHFDAMVYRKLNLDPNVVLSLYRSKLLASINSMSIFTPLVHPVNLAEDRERVNMFINFIKFAKEKEEVWITSCSEILNVYQALRNYKIEHCNLIQKENRHMVKMKVMKLNTHTKKKEYDMQPCKRISLVYKVKGSIEKVNCKSDYKIIKLSPYENVLCMPFDFSKDEINIFFKIETSTSQNKMESD